MRCMPHKAKAVKAQENLPHPARPGPCAIPYYNPTAQRLGSRFFFSTIPYYNPKIYPIRKQVPLSIPLFLYNPIHTAL